jgi:hypothetical protein
MKPHHSAMTFRHNGWQGASAVNMVRLLRARRPKRIGATPTGGYGSQRWTKRTACLTAVLLKSRGT